MCLYTIHPFPQQFTYTILVLNQGSNTVLKDVNQELVAKIAKKALESAPSPFLKITEQEICGLRKSDG